MSDVYYRVMIDRNDKICFPCMQDFDEIDYDQKRFITTTKFESEELAEDWVANNLAYCKEAIKMSKEIGYPIAAALDRYRR